jgi:hypothetical protein
MRLGERLSGAGGGRERAGSDSSNLNEARGSVERKKRDLASSLPSSCSTTLALRLRPRFAFPSSHAFTAPS